MTAIILSGVISLWRILMGAAGWINYVSLTLAREHRELRTRVTSREANRKSSVH